jgi:hypothetical protein
MKYTRTFLPALLAIIIPCGSSSLFIHASPGSNSLIQLAQKVTNARHTEINNARQELLTAFKDAQNTNARTLSEILTAYHHNKATLLYPKHATTLHTAIDTFAQKPGFQHKIYELLLYADIESYIQGHIYEIEKALELHQNGESITHFGYQFQCSLSGTRRSIDLATESHLIECKNINWGIYIGDSVTNIKNQLKSYKEHAKALSQIDSKKKFVLHSKQKISDDWLEWLDENEIAYEEDISS